MINKYTRGKVIIKNRLMFGGGYPKFRWVPKIIGCRSTMIMIFWLGTELVFFPKMAVRNA